MSRRRTAAAVVVIVTAVLTAGTAATVGVPDRDVARGAEAARSTSQVTASRFRASSRK